MDTSSGRELPARRCWKLWRSSNQETMCGGGSAPLGRAEPSHCTRKKNQVRIALCCLVVLTTGWLNASKPDAKKSSLASYLARVQMEQPAAPTLSPGSIWVDSGRMASLSTDYKAMVVGDLIEIVVVQGVTSTNANSVATNRTLST